ncbi:hemicentin-1-like [Pecten maximus]|uniref:hemicentin-1-like n=1 Tax=Pecten maximus TaxID=6579 RepID=UPI001458BC27|nr:hemicentin-1-like [Pecten maximus]XP_033738110.1 hemicentin-1-like [Pecten maximus]XP_033738118.1 hemicentin-1-like [Pecten maximus]
MARRKEHLALLSLSFLVQLTCITTHAFAVSPQCVFKKNFNSTAYNKLQDLTLEDCTNGDPENVLLCKQPHSSSPKAVSLRCLCGRHEMIEHIHLECDVNECCTRGNWICLNGGRLLTCKPGYFQCNCSDPFRGERCELVSVNRKCSKDAFTADLPSCESVGESPSPCLHTVNHTSFHCDIPVPRKDVSGLTECSQIPEGGLVTPDPVTEGPVNTGQWSAWSQWSRCSMSEDARSTGPCMCRRRECKDESCQGTDIQVTNCTEHGHWTDWTPWSACSSTRGRSGKRTRYRFCSNPAPKYGGRSCDGKSEDTDVQTERCNHDCPVSGSELQMTEFSSWGNITFENEVPGWLRVRTKLVCQAPGGELAEISGEEVAQACYLLKVSVEHCHESRCTPLKGLRKLIDNTSVSRRYKPAETVVEP